MSQPMHNGGGGEVPGEARACRIFEAQLVNLATLPGGVVSSMGGILAGAPRGGSLVHLASARLCMHQIRLLAMK